jgi:MSHA biogenesis protein MshK
MKTQVVPRIFVIALLAGAAAAQAQALRDPTRPPGVSVARGVSGVASRGDLVLQSVLISPERRAAIISGRVVRPGETVDGYRLIAIGAGEAVLRKDGQSRTLQLYPAVDLRPPAVAAGNAQSGNRSDPEESGTAMPADGG